MLTELYNYFYNVVFNFDYYSEELGFLDGQVQVGVFLDGVTHTYEPIYIPYGCAIAQLCALVSLIFIVILCCLFVYKIIKLIGGLIR